MPGQGASRPGPRLHPSQKTSAGRPATGIGQKFSSKRRLTLGRCPESPPMQNLNRSALQAIVTRGSASRVAGECDSRTERSGPRQRRRNAMLLLVAAAFIAAGYVVTSAIRAWRMIDKCLDRGGRWSQAAQSCRDGGSRVEDEDDAALCIAAATNPAHHVSPRCAPAGTSGAVTLPRCRPRTRSHNPNGLTGNQHLLQGAASTLLPRICSRRSPLRMQQELDRLRLSADTPEPHDARLWHWRRWEFFPQRARMELPANTLHPLRAPATVTPHVTVPSY